MKGLFYYQNPDENEIHGFHCKVHSLGSVLEFEEGFLLSTFNKEEVYNLIPTSTSPLKDLDSVSLNDAAVVSIGFDVYRESIEKAIEFCRKHRGKAVMSRVVVVPIPVDFSLRNFFVELCSKYKHSFNYCVHLENGTTWIGATPEVLVRSSHNKCAVYSLAGSRDAENPFDWTDKEKKEQLFVTDEIAERLNELSIKYQIEGPRTVRAGNLEHLLSEFSFDAQNALEVADELHPTPAVCGLPPAPALEFIRQNEQHDRKFYAGIIGWKKDGEMALYVNLRCAEVTTDGLCCYAGGGITEDSTAEKEWEETAIKSQTLLSVLKKN